MVLAQLWLEVVSNALVLETLAYNFAIQPIAWIGRKPVTISKLNGRLTRFPNLELATRQHHDRSRIVIAHFECYKKQ